MARAAVARACLWNFELIGDSWYHSAERQSVDKNFAVHTPIWDRLFGTYYLPDRWPDAYGLSDGSEVPRRWISQLLYPIRGREAR